eukprot:5313662-Alexandrium_andersonii.AAC.1
MANTMPERLANAFRARESLLVGIAPPAGRGAVRDHDAPGTRLFRIAGLSAEFGASQLLCKT